MLIGGLQKFTALDYPGKIAATVFTAGCNFRCPFCHNGEIVKIGGEGSFDRMEEKEVLDFLRSRVGELDGVCITGGEPTLHLDLLDFIERIKEMGFLVKLDTNGSNIIAAKNAIDRNLADYFAIDIKTSFEKYHLVNTPDGVADIVLETIDYITNTGTPFELRTTVVPGIVALEDFDSIAEKINNKNPEILRNISRYSIQAFRPQKCLDKNFEKVIPYSDETLEIIAEKMRNYCKKVDILK